VHLLSYPEAAVIGVLQGVSELFPVSSVGHSVLLPAVIGGSWQRDLNVSDPESPYLAFIVGLHVATALALIVFYRRDWARIIGGLATSIRDRRVESSDQRLAWLLILATIPVGVVGLVGEHFFRTHLAKPVPTAILLAVNGLVLLGGERLRTRQRVPAEPAAPDSAALDSTDADERLGRQSTRQAVGIGTTQILALAPGFSRSGVAMVAGLLRGMSHDDAVRFSFLLATPVILAAGVLKIPDLTGPLGNGIHGQVIVGSVLSFVGAYVSVRFLTRWFHTRSMRPFGIYCLVAGIGSLIWFAVR
jgi:undecaprenyl-diphosphatase